MVRLSLTVAVILALLLAACGSDSDEPDQAGASPTTASPTAAASATATATQPPASPTTPATASPAASPSATVANSNAPYELVATWGEPALLVQPIDVAVTPDGGFVVANMIYGKLIFFDGQGNPTDTWDINYARGVVAVDGSGNVYAPSDHSPGLTKFDPAGDEVATLELGDEQLRFSLNDIAASQDGYLYASSGDGRSGSSSPGPFRGVYVFEPAGDRIAEWAAPLAYHPQAVAVGPDGVVYVSAVEKNADHRPVRDVLVRIERDSYNPNDWIESQIALPEGMIIDALAVAPNGELYLLQESDLNGGQPTPVTMARINTTGAVLAEWTLDDSGALGIPTATGIATAPDNGVYLTDTLNNRILKLSPNGAVLAAYGSAEPNIVSIPTGITVGPDGTIYVRDSGLNRVEMFAPDGEPAGVVPLPGEFRGFAVASPPDVAVGASGTIWVSQSPPIRIFGLAKDGTNLHEWGNAFIDLSNGERLFFEPGSLAVTPDNTVLIADVRSGDIVEFTADGEVVASWTLDKDEARVQSITVANGTRYAMALAERDDPEGSPTVQILRLGDGGLIEIVADIPSASNGSNGSNGRLYPVDVAIDSNGTIFLADIVSRQIVMFSAGGDEIGRWSLEGQLDRPGMTLSIAAGNDGRIYVADGELQQIFVYAPVG
jgi:sugar lactone lactonase YvrE